MFYPYPFWEENMLNKLKYYWELFKKYAYLILLLLGFILILFASRKYKDKMYDSLGGKISEIYKKIDKIRRSKPDTIADTVDDRFKSS